MYFSDIIHVMCINKIQTYVLRYSWRAHETHTNENCSVKIIYEQIQSFIVSLVLIVALHRIKAYYHFELKNKQSFRST